MAKKMRKKNEDKFLKNIIIGFCVATAVLILAVILYGVFSNELKYDDFEQVGNYQLITTMDDASYAVYLYSEECPACKGIKTQVLEFADNNKSNLPLYLMDTAQTSGYPEYVVGPAGESLTSTPTLMVIQDGVMTQFIVGADQITSFFDGVEVGLYTFD